MLKIGLIGCGYWGPKLARNLHALPDTELTWIADLRPDLLAKMQELYPNVSTTLDHHQILESDVEAVVIATPISTHHSLAMEALRAGKHILVEKPLAATVPEACEIAETADKLGLVAMVGHTFQYNPAVIKIRNMIANGELGQIYYINSNRVNLGLLQPDVNVIWDLAPHDISIMLYILDSMPLAVRAYGNSYVQRERQIHDVVYICMQFPHNVLVNLHLSWLDPVKIRQITIVGSKKMLVYDDVVDEKITLFDKGVEMLPNSDSVEKYHMSYRNGSEIKVPYEWREPLYLECDAFSSSIRTGLPAPSSAKVGVKVVQVLEMAQKSLLNGGRMEQINT